MDNENIEQLKQKAVKGTMFNFISNLMTKFANMLVQLVLARLILPEEFGTVALLNIFITISHVLVSTGFATAIIQKKDLTETDKSSAFFMSVGISVLLFAIIFITSPYIALFYEDPQLSSVLRLYSIVIVIGGFCSVKNSLVSKELKFKITMWRGLITVVVQGSVGIVLAYMGLGVWALVASYIVGNLSSAVYLHCVVRWTPKRLFSWQSVKKMFKFSSNVLISSLFNTVYSDIRALVIGKVYTTETLAFYDRANLIRGYIFDTTIGAISTVMLPVLSKVNDDVAKVKKGLRRIVSLNMFVSTPMRIGLILVAKPLILLMLGENWAESVPFLQLICITNLLAPTTNRTNAYLAIGKSSLALRMQIISKGTILLGIFLTVRISVYMVVVSALIGNLISFLEGLYTNKKYLGYTVKEQLSDIIRPLIFSVLMGAVVYLVGLIPMHYIPLLILQCIVGVGAYVGLSVVFKFESFYYFIDVVKKLVSKKKGGSANAESD